MIKDKSEGETREETTKEENVRAREVWWYGEVGGWLPIIRPVGTAAAATPPHTR
jgi:hypothetical protein